MKIFFLFILMISQTTFACEVEVIKLTAPSPISSEGEFELTIHAYLAQNSEIQNIILPPIGGTTTLEGRYAKKVCMRGTSSFVFVNWTNDMESTIDDLAIHDRAIKRALFSIELFLDYSPLKTSILGTSLGGVYSGIAMGRFELLTKAVIITSGTNLAGILAYGRLPETIKQREARMELFGFKTQKEYMNALEDKIKIYAQDYIEGYRNKRLLHYRSFNDIVIPVEYQDQLIGLFDQDKTQLSSIRFSHRNTIIWAYARKSNYIANYLSSN